MSPARVAPPALLAVAHGTADSAGLAELAALVDLVRAELAGVRVTLSYLDVAEPAFAADLDATSGPAVVVPLFLSSGYHVKSDITRVAAPRSDVVVTPAIGPDPRLAEAAELRRCAAIPTGTPSPPADAVRLLVAAGSSDPEAVAELKVAADQLRRLTGSRVQVGLLTGPERLRAIGPELLVVNYLLAPGHFDAALRALAGSQPVGAPLGAHPLVAEVVVDRYREAAARIA